MPVPPQKPVKMGTGNLKVSPCRMAGSPEGQDLVILAHNYKSHFGRLKALKVGDRVTFTALNGTTYVYTVGAMETVSPFAVEDVTGSDWPLTLFTCTLGGKTRLVVYCGMADG